MHKCFSHFFKISSVVGLVFLSGCNINFTNCLLGCDRVVTTSYGKVKGRSNSITNSWYGIPYAAPASGKNRWYPPQPVEPWDHVMDAKLSLKGCNQWATPTGVMDFSTSEDCLDLTIWAPDKPGNYPVLIWVFGGGFLLGSGNELSYRGQELSANEDVVVVTINHRLGPLGYLSLPGLTKEQGRSGNYGMLDQVAALKWINEEISEFGGDPDRITVFGESAGGKSTCLLLSSPLSRTLFDNAIISSGPCGEWMTLKQEDADARGAKLAESFGCDQADPTEQLACMRKLSPSEMKDKLDVPFNELFLIDGNDWKFFPYLTKDDHFITDTFEGMIQANKILIDNGSMKAQNIILGVMKDEGSLFEALRDHPSISQYETYITQRYQEMNGDDINNVLQMYPISDFINVGHAVSTISGDRNIICPGVKASTTFTSAGYPVYQYQFTEYSDSILRKITSLQLGTNPPPLGIFHSGEIAFLFGINGPTSELRTEGQKAVSRTIQSYIGSLARTGNPNDALMTAPAWPQYDIANKAYLHWGADFETSNDLRGSFCDYWIAEDFFADNL